MHSSKVELTADFFSPRFPEAAKMGSKMIKAIQDAAKEERP